MIIQIYPKQAVQEIIVAPRGQKIPNVAHLDPCLECICTLGTVQLSVKLMSYQLIVFHLFLVFGLSQPQLATSEGRAKLPWLLQARLRA